MKPLKGADWVAQALVDEGAKVVFTLPGFFIMNILHALHGTNIKVITCKHELSAAFAADGYSRVSGEPGFVIVNTGPSCLNTIAALKTSYKDGIPVVMLIGTDISERMNNESDFQTVTFPNNIVNYVLTVKGNDIYKTIQESIYISKINPCTPVVVQIPWDISRARWSKQTSFNPSRKFFSHSKLKKNYENLLRVMIEALNISERPLIVIGGGVLQARSEKLIVRFIHKYNIPAVCTSIASGVLQEDDALFFGTPGIIAPAKDNKIISECDLILAFGTKLSRRFLHNIDTDRKRIFQINLEESHIRNDLNVIPVICDVRYVLSELLKTKNLRVRESWKTKKSFNEQFHIVKEWNMTSALQCIFKEVANPIIFCDDGTYTIKTLQLFRPLQPRTLLFSGNMATGGYALSGAIGAKLAKKSRKVVVITGDGGLLSTIGELQVYAENKLKILIVVFNNGGYDSINQWSQIYKVPLDSNFDHVDFTTIAKGFGIEAYTINNLENSENVLRNYKWNEPLLLNLIVPSEQVNCHFPI